MIDIDGAQDPHVLFVWPGIRVIYTTSCVVSVTVTSNKVSFAFQNAWATGSLADHECVSSHAVEVRDIQLRTAPI